MTRNLWLALALGSVAFPAAPLLAEQTRTVTIDNAHVEGTREIARDREAGTLTRETGLTRKSDGATASGDFERQRTENGVTRDRSSTDFQGRTASWHYERKRTGNGWAAQGEHVQRYGDVVGYRSRARVGENRIVRRSVVTRNGQPVAARRTVRPRRSRR